MHASLSESLRGYDPAAHVDDCLTVYRSLREMIGRFVGSLQGMVVLEIGAGHDMPHSPIYSALMAAEGARVVYSTDRAHPCSSCADPRRKAFWREAYARLPELSKCGLSVEPWPRLIPLHNSLGR